MKSWQRLPQGLMLCVCALVSALGGAAADPGDSRAAATVPSQLSFGVGWFDVTGGGDHDAIDLRVEYRHGTPLLWRIRPWAGLEATGDGAVYGLAGGLVELQLSPELVTTASLGAGLYEEGDGRDLGHTVEFRSQIELAYLLPDSSRLALAFSHISNAHLDDRNPGTEIVTLYYHMPLSRLAAW